MTKDAKKILKIGVMMAFFFFIILYAFFRSYDLVFGVKIKNVNVVDGAKIEQSTIDITGNAKNATKLVLNGREISIDKNGNFSETVALLSGYNIVSIEAEDKFGHKDFKNYKLIHEVESP